MDRASAWIQASLPHRGLFGSPRPDALRALALPPRPMPSRQGLRPLKAWRYVGIFDPELMVCVATIRIGPARQCFWAVWDRAAGRLHERTRLGAGRVRLAPGRVHVADGPVAIELELLEAPGVETICPSGASYAWTRKQGRICARGTVTIEGVNRELAARAIVDDTCERTVWIDGQPAEVAPVQFGADLGSVAGLRFMPEAIHERRENRLLVRSRYRQPFGASPGSRSRG